MFVSASAMEPWRRLEVFLGQRRSMAEAMKIL